MTESLQGQAAFLSKSSGSPIPSTRQTEKIVFFSIGPHTVARIVVAVVGVAIQIVGAT